MNIETMNKKELQSLRVKIDKQIHKIEDREKESKGIQKAKSNFLQIQGQDKVFCVHFNGKEKHDIEYVYMTFTKNKGYYNYSASKNKINCASTVDLETMHKHCFLDEFTSSWYFFTLKPETLEQDLIEELNYNIKKKRKKLQKEISKNKKNIRDFLKVFNMIKKQVI